MLLAAEIEEHDVWSAYRGADYVWLVDIRTDTRFGNLLDLRPSTSLTRREIDDPLICRPSAIKRTFTFVLIESPAFGGLLLAATGVKAGFPRQRATVPKTQGADQKSPHVAI